MTLYAEANPTAYTYLHLEALLTLQLLLAEAPSLMLNDVLTKNWG